MPQSNFVIDLTVGQFKGQAMSLEVRANDCVVYTNTSPDQAKIRLEFDCELPAYIEFDVAGKQPFDTLVDAAGNIVEDKFVRVDRIILDRMPIEYWIVESKLIDFYEQKTNYFYKNGLGTINIPNRDSFEFFLDLMTKIDQ